jgi:carbon-monoxide dehydrogenase medium subunit
MKSFGYQKVFILEEAFRLLDQYQDKARILAGGTDLLVKIRHSILSPEILIDIKEIPGLDEIRYDPAAGLQIGALASIHSLETSPVIKEKYGVISQAAGSLGSFQIRARATLGGNLCNVSPHGDMAPCLISLGARVKIAGKKEDRLVPLEEFFIGPGITDLRPGEILAAVQLPIPLPFTGCIYIKHSIRRAMDLAVVGVAVALSADSEKVKCQEVKIALGAVGPIPLRAKRAESRLWGQKLDEFSISEASRIASEEVQPISDIRASSEYRREMVRVITERALKQAQGALS